jgi:hypothetical protein
VHVDEASGRLGGSAQASVGGGLTWSVEWGPPQRAYLHGAELCLRSELRVPAGLQALVLDRPLRARLEREVFESYVQDLHTRVDTRTPPEMRWLVMLPALPHPAATALGQAFSGVASDGPWATRWLDDTLASLLGTAHQAVGDDTPLVLMLSRSRLSLRTALQVPQTLTLDALATCFRGACESALRASVA